jgi:uncharacterized membrane protein
MFKKPLQSGAVRWGIFVLAGALLSFFGVDAEKGEIQNTVDLFNKVWPQIMAVVAALGIIWGRIKAWRFDVSVFRTSTFWSAVVAGLVGVGQAINLDLGELTSASEVIKNVLPDIMLMVGSIFAIYKRSKATLPILPAGPQNVMAKAADLAVAYAPRYSPNAPYRAIPALPRFAGWILGRLSWDSIVAVTGWVIERLASVTPGQWREVLGWILAAEGMKDMTGAQRWSWVMQKILEAFPTWSDLIAKTIASLGLWILAHEGRIHLKAMDGMPRLGVILPSTDDITNTSRTPP